MNGNIVVESELGKGTKFSFTIKTQVSVKAIRTYVYNNMAGLEGKWILVVDDNETNRIILKNQLHSWKFRSAMAASAEEALAILDTSRFDLMITDMDMPEMDGLAFARVVKDRQPELPIILLSSVGNERAHEHGSVFSSILTKPVKHHLLCTHIVNHLRHQKNTSFESSKNILSADFAKKYPLEVLIADDNLINQKLTGRILTKMGYQPAVAANGHDALQLLSTKKFDLIFMDVQMPEMDGLEATRIIRSANQHQPVIIAMTANAMEQDREECLRNGMNDYISKPIKMEDMVAMIIKWSIKISEGAA